jgi:acetyltransferase-like isoleucine patch superfamily enzyme
MFLVLEYLIVLIKGKILGIDYVIKYLRNPNPKLNRKILKEFGAKIGKNSTIKRSLFLDNTWEDENSRGDFSNLIIGENCYIGDDCYFDLADKIEIRNNSVISGRVSVITHSDCNRSFFLSKRFPRKCAAVLISEGAWIGFNSTILSGITIAENSIIGANSLVTRDNSINSIFAGSPAKKLSDIL